MDRTSITRRKAGVVGHFAGGLVSELCMSCQPPPKHHVQECRGRKNQKPAAQKPEIKRPDFPVLHSQYTGPLTPNNIHFICGVPNPNARRMTINLCGKDVVAFHFDVRFDYFRNKNVIVRNTRKDVWGSEETSLPDGRRFPFRPNVYFEVMILTEPQCFKVAVNNEHFLEYKHRILPLERINTLSISGDVTITEVRFQK